MKQPHKSTNRSSAISKAKTQENASVSHMTRPVHNCGEHEVPYYRHTHTHSQTTQDPAQTQDDYRKINTNKSPNKIVIRLPKKYNKSSTPPKAAHKKHSGSTYSKNNIATQTTKKQHYQYT
jgi:hypothetical protein